MVLEIGTVLEVIGFTLDVFEKWDEHEARWATLEDERAARWATVEVERERNRILGAGFSKIGDQVRGAVEELRRQGAWNQQAWKANGALLLAVKEEVERAGREGAARAARREEREKQELLKTVLAEWRTADLLAANGGPGARTQLSHALSRLSGEATKLCSKAELAMVRSGMVVDCGLFATGCMAQARGMQDIEEIAATILRDGAEKLRTVAVRMVEGQSLYEVGVVRWAALARVIELRRDLLRAAGDKVAAEPWQDGLADLRRALMQEGGRRAARSERLPLRTVQDWVEYATHIGKSLREIEVGAVGITVAEAVSPAGVPGDPPADAVLALLRLGSDARKGWERRVAAELGAEVRLMFPAKPVEDKGAASGALPGGNTRALPGELTTATAKAAGITLIEIPLNDGFWMGSPDIEVERDKDEKAHYVRLTRRYAMADVPVTQRLYQAVMGTNPSHFKGDPLPVEMVSWEMAVEFCNRLSDKDGLQRCYRPGAAGMLHCDFSANGYRLATEAEWEYGARANDIYKYAGGSDLGGVAWYKENSGGKTQPVRQKRCNAFGLYDMSGNVWEWCWDIYAEYPDSTAAQPAVDPAGPAVGSDRVNRGSGWLGVAQSLRVARRNRYSPGNVGNGLGFRIVRSIR